MNRRDATLLLCLVWRLWMLACSVGGSPTADEAFLAENRQKPGVIELPSGLQYKIVVNGTGTFHPLPLCQCLVHYQGRLVDGSVFDSSFERGEPLQVAPSQVIDGWAEAMHMQVQGDEWEVYVPPALGYGERGDPPDIPGNAVLIFTMQMVAVDCDQKMPALKCDIPTGEGCSDRELDYLQKVRLWPADKVSGELDRLQKILAEDTPLREDLKEWIIRREYLLLHQSMLSLHDEL